LKGREIKTVPKVTFRWSLLCELNKKGKLELPYFMKVMVVVSMR